MTSLDLTGLEVDALQITGKNALTLKGSKTLNTNLTINGIPGISFSGIEEVQNVSVSNMPATITGRVEYNFPGLKKIGTLSVSQAYGASLGVLRFPDLTEISGKLTLSEGFGQKVQPTEFPVLRIVNNMTYTGVCDALRFPALEEVTGELNIKTSYVNGSLVSMLQEIYTPVLKKVGILVLTTYSKNQDSWCNNVLTNLDCFRALENVGVINIEYQLGLVSFKGLEKAIGKNVEDASMLDTFSLEMFENIAYVMAKHADTNIPDTPEELLDGFNTFSIYQVLPQLIELWGLNVQTDVSAKKNFVQQITR